MEMEDGRIKARMKKGEEEGMNSSTMSRQGEVNRGEEEKKKKRKKRKGERQREKHSGNIHTHTHNRGRLSMG